MEKPTFEEACQILGASPDDDLQAIKKAYHRIAFENHEDRIAPLQDSAPQEYETRVKRFKQAVVAMEVVEEHRGEALGKSDSIRFDSTNIGIYLQDTRELVNAAQRIRQQQKGALGPTDEQLDLEYAMRLHKIRQRMETVTEKQVDSSQYKPFTSLYQDILHDEYRILHGILDSDHVAKKLRKLKNPFGASHGGRDIYTGDASPSGRGEIVSFLEETLAKTHAQIDELEELLRHSRQAYEERFDAMENDGLLETSETSAGHTKGVKPLNDIDDIKLTVRQDIYEEFIARVKHTQKQITDRYLPDAQKEWEKSKADYADRALPDNYLDLRDTLLKRVGEYLDVLSVADKTTDQKMQQLTNWLQNISQPKKTKKGKLKEQVSTGKKGWDTIETVVLRGEKRDDGSYFQLRYTEDWRSGKTPVIVNIELEEARNWFASGQSDQPVISSHTFVPGDKDLRDNLPRAKEDFSIDSLQKNQFMKPPTQTTSASILKAKETQIS